MTRRLTGPLPLITALTFAGCAHASTPQPETVNAEGPVVCAASSSDHDATVGAQPHGHLFGVGVATAEDTVGKSLHDQPHGHFLGAEGETLFVWQFCLPERR